MKRSILILVTLGSVTGCNLAARPRGPVQACAVDAAASCAASTPDLRWALGAVSSAHR